MSRETAAHLEMELFSAKRRIEELEAELAAAQAEVERLKSEITTDDVIHYGPDLDRIEELSAELAAAQDEIFMFSENNPIWPKYKKALKELSEARAALKRIIDLASNKFSCVCGRITGVESLKVCAAKALTEGGAHEP